jgi:pyruvate kinase
MRRAKIVATIGPASCSADKLHSLILAGMDVARVNMSHGDHAQHSATIKTTREIAAGLKRPVAILLDLCGPKIRTGTLIDHKPVLLEPGQKLSITTEEVVGDATRVSTSYSRLPQDVARGNQILLADGLIELRVDATSEKDIVCSVINGGLLGEHKGINVPGAMLSAPSLTEKDYIDLKFGLEQEVDYIALSFVRSANDLREAKKAIKQFGADTPVIAKIEKREALEDLDGIIEATDGVMVARGDLGVETAVESVPFFQKQIIAKANAAEKLVITATQMLESMTHEPRPTRAEASDVANAILDGTDAVMLSGETAAGEYPVQSVETMARIISYTEKTRIETERTTRTRVLEQTGEEGRAIAEAAMFASREMKTEVIVVFSNSGKMARHIAALRPPQRIIAFTPHERTSAALAAIWGLEPRLLDFSGRSEDLLSRADEKLLEEGVVSKGQTIIVMAGLIPEQRGLSSMMKLHRIGE